MTGLLIIVVYAALFVGSMFVVNLITAKSKTKDYTALKTVTFGDESAVRPNRWASVISVLVLFLIWGAFTGSVISPIHVPGPFEGDTSFTYTAQNAGGDTDDATVTVRVHEVGAEVEDPVVEPGDGFAKNDVDRIGIYRSKIIRMTQNDEGEDLAVVAINGEPIAANETVQTEDGRITMNERGQLNFVPDRGIQMQPLYLPSPERVVEALIDVQQNGFRNYSLFEHLYYSLARVLGGFALGALVGIPLGYAMGLSNWFRGWFDPIVEFMRPVPPLALIPLIIIWFGIDETGKVVLLFLAALWIMAIGARAGVSGVNITKVHAAYSLGASKAQILRHVIIPNSLPEIFTAARVAMGVCWGTVVAAELVAANVGAGMMITTASKFQQTYVVVMGIILIGIIGFGIDILMRKAEDVLVPWKGRS
ncbi:ABC transporter permease [Jannaschia donghaensis]|uniref:Putative aliphatic sulfonates transport permease protein SsuC n=1 Tax=Jannaschia donghaensis TaxID=420998 RepID=A0A0M6YLY7_9RHOB|nr:ABC transporter permease [Jannaschia donghaensis]CTQ50533.1 Putative aliphatic sulfonates transport permease protein SsuC [Jannaschia donghaensis]